MKAFVGNFWNIFSLFFFSTFKPIYFPTLITTIKITICVLCVCLSFLNNFVICKWGNWRWIRCSNPLKCIYLASGEGKMQLLECDFDCDFVLTLGRCCISHTEYSTSSALLWRSLASTMNAVLTYVTDFWVVRFCIYSFLWYNLKLKFYFLVK